MSSYSPLPTEHMPSAADLKATADAMKRITHTAALALVVSSLLYHLLAFFLPVDARPERVLQVSGVITVAYAKLTHVRCAHFAV
jgi:hypothetical protein